MIESKRKIKQIPLTNLLIDIQNPRYDPRKNQHEAIATIANEQRIKLVNLAQDILDKGLNPSELPIVIPTDEKNNYIVKEGNRRIAAIKLVASPSLAASIGLPSNLVKRYKSLNEEAGNRLPQQIDCAVLSPEDSSHWILLRHTGENQGIGVVMWDGLQTQRFRGMTPALQVIEHVKSSNYLDQTTRKKLSRIAITNIERILSTPDARKLLGIDVKGGLLELKSPEEEAIARLAMIVNDIANKHINVSDLDTKEQRITYANEVASRPLSKPNDKGASAGTTEETDAAGSKTGEGTKSKPISIHRRALIPGRFKLAIPHARINKIYHELCKLNVENFVNCSAVMFRVFLEMSVDHFAHKHGISLKIPVKQKSVKSSVSQKKLPDKNMTLRQKLSTIANHLESQNICTKPELQGVRKLISNRDHVLSVDSLHAYVHNKDYNPIATELKTTWDNLQTFIERIWTS